MRVTGAVVGAIIVSACLYGVLFPVSTIKAENWLTWLKPLHVCGGAFSERRYLAKHLLIVSFCGVCVKRYAFDCPPVLC